MEEEKLKLVDEAAKAISHVVKAFQFFRKENSNLNEFLANIEAILLKRRCERNGVDCKKRKCDFDDCKYSTESNPKIVEGHLATTDVKSKTRLNNLPDRKTPEEQVFGDSLLLETILGILPVSDLKTCRRINFSWNSATTKILLQREALKITFSLYDTARDQSNPSSLLQEPSQIQNPVKSKSKQKLHHLRGLSDLVANSLSFNFTFPCSYFIFYCGSLTIHDLQNFLSKYGFIIKHLYIDVNSDPDCDQHEFLKLMRKLLACDLPNIEFLELGKFPPLWDQEEDLGQLSPEPKFHSKSLLLSKLKSLHFHTQPPKKIFQDLLKAAPNIQSIGMGDGWCESDSVIPWLIETKMVDLLTLLEITLYAKNLEVYNNLASQNLKLKKLIININDDDSKVFRSRVGQVISKFLKSCSSTLQEFHSQPLGYFPGLEIPIMHKLKKIQVLNYEDAEAHHKVFPNGLILSHTFPVLECYESTVFYDWVDFDTDCITWDACFGANSGDLLTSVKSIHFSYGIPLPWIENFSNMFENITSLRIGFITDFVEASKALWKMVQLKTLVFIVGVHLEENMFPAIDMGFTGFSEETCLDLYESSREVDVSTLSALRENPSILDAKSLRKLHVLIYDPTEDTRTSDTFRCMSHVSGLFAFQMCPELEVTFSAGAYERSSERILRNGLSPIYPYIGTVKHFRDTYDTNSLVISNNYK